MLLHFHVAHVKRNIERAITYGRFANGSIVRQRDSDTKHYLSDRLILVWYSCETSGNINMPAACDINIFPTTVCTAWFYLKIESRCRSENHHYLRVGKRDTISSAVRWRKRESSAHEKPERVFLFSRKLSPREKLPFPLASLPTSKHLSGNTARARYRSSIEHRMTASPMADEADLFVGSTRSFPGKFSPTPTLREHRA